jgi:hypothetical protein
MVLARREREREMDERKRWFDEKFSREKIEFLYSLFFIHRCQVFPASSLTILHLSSVFHHSYISPLPTDSSSI